MSGILAFSLSNSVTEVGALAAFAALLGIAVLSLLVFSQAREIKRLREWAGRAPERAAETEQRVSADAAARLRGGAPPAPAGAPVRVVPRKTPLVSAPVSTAVNATVAAVVPATADSPGAGAAAGSPAVKGAAGNAAVAASAAGGSAALANQPGGAEGSANRVNQPGGTAGSMPLANSTEAPGATPDDAAAPLPRPAEPGLDVWRRHGRRVDRRPIYRCLACSRHGRSPCSRRLRTGAFASLSGGARSPGARFFVGRCTRDATSHRGGCDRCRAARPLARAGGGCSSGLFASGRYAPGRERASSLARVDTLEGGCTGHKRRCTWGRARGEWA